MFDRWMNEPTSHSISESGVSMTAPSGSDFIIDPRGGNEKANAPFLFSSFGSEFTVQATVTGEFKEEFDSACLMVYADTTHWAKLCYEQTDRGVPAVVSVVTSEHSDDCNGESISSGPLRLQVSRSGRVCAFHYALPDEPWKMKRIFRFPMEKADEALHVGLVGQSPAGNGCRVHFSELSLQSTSVSDLRRGS